MNHLRHGPLLIWIVILIVVGGLTGAVVSSGRGHVVVHQNHGAGLLSSDASSIHALTARLSAEESIIYTGGILAPWALEEAKIAKTAAVARAKIVGSDAVVKAYLSVAQACGTMANLGPRASGATRVRAEMAVGSAIDNLVSASAGVPPSSAN